MLFAFTKAIMIYYGGFLYGKKTDILKMILLTRKENIMGIPEDFEHIF